MSTLQTFFQQLTTEGGSGNFLIINLSHQDYLQFAGSKNSNIIHCEACGNQLDATQISTLINLGWNAPSKDDMHNNYGQSFDLGQQPALQLEQLILDTAAQVYSTSKEAFSYELQLE